MKNWFLYLFSKAFLKTALFSVLFLAAALFASLRWLKSATHHGQTVLVPNLQFMDLQEALDSLEAKGLTFEVIDSTHYVPKAPIGSVIEQFPSALSQVKLGRKVLLSTNPARVPKYPLPSFKDQLLSYVKGKFNSKGFSIDTIVVRPDLSHDLVLEIIDRNGKVAKEGEYYETGSAFKFIISGGQSGSISMLPNLLGARYSEAIDLLQTYGLNEGAVLIDPEVVDTANAYIWKQFPEFDLDQELPAGSLVDLWLTADSTKVPVVETVDSLFIDAASSDTGTFIF
mgnify:CR=1 FL=1